MIMQWLRSWIAQGGGIICLEINYLKSLSGCLGMSCSAETSESGSELALNVSVLSTIDVDVILLVSRSGSIDDICFAMRISYRFSGSFL